MDAGELALPLASFTKVKEFDISQSAQAATIMEYEVTKATENIVAGKKYRFITSADNAIGVSAFSSEVRFAAAALPAKPSSITRGVASTQKQVQVNWPISPDNEILITGYVLEADLK
jgi:hypothetical protein